MVRLSAFLTIRLLLLSSIVSAVRLVARQSRQCDPQIVSGRTPNDQFKFPPASCYAGNYVGISSYVRGTALTILWACTKSPVDLAIIQEHSTAPGGAGTISWLARNYTGTTFNWNGYPPQDLQYGKTFFFELFDPTSKSGGALFASDYINITSTVSDTTSVSSSSITTSSSSSSATQAATTTGSTGQATAVAASASNSNSNSVAIGAGVGGGIGGALLIGAGLAFWYFRGKKKQKAAAQGEHNPPYMTDKPFYPPAQTYSPAPVYAEVQGSQQPYYSSRQELDPQHQGYFKQPVTQQRPYEM